MKKSIRFSTPIFFFFLFSLPCFEHSGGSASAQNFQKYFDRDLGSTNSIGEVGHSVLQTLDGGYIAVGYSDNFGIGHNDIFIVRLKVNGDTLWTKIYGNAGGDDIGRSIVQTADGGFAIAGETQSGAGLSDAAIMKIDSNGTLLWSKAFGGIKKDLGHSIIETSDEGLIFAGEAISFSSTGYEEIFLVKVDKNGNLLWAKTLSGGDGDIARFISKTADGGFVVSGEEGSFNYGPFIAKFNSNADTSWCRSYRAAFSSYEGRSVRQTADGGYIVAANTYGGSIGGKDMVALKVTSAGSVSWTREIGTVNTDEVSEIIQTNDGGYALSGTASPGSYYDLIMAKLNGIGVLQWSKNYSGQYGTTYATNSRFQIIQTNDHGLMTIGSLYNNFGNTLAGLYNGFDMMVVKTDSAGDGLPFGCIRNANLQTSPVNWAAYGTPFTVTSVTPTITNSVFIQKFTAGNTGNVGVKINIPVIPSNCGLCDGSATANTCDSSGFYCSGTNPYSYGWSDSQNQVSQTATGLCTGSYTVTITDFVGCTGIKTVALPTGAMPQEICLVTVDSTSTKNLIIWEKPVTTTIDSFRVYREIGLNNYVKIGTVPYEDYSKFVDTVQGINPNITSYRYKISTLDNCGNESIKSNHHRTIHLSTPQFTAPSTFDLIWTNDYEGFTLSQYYILRDGNNNGNWVVIDSATFGNNSYTDLNAPSDSATYIIEAVHPTGCTVTKSSENHNSSRSNKTYPLTAPSGMHNYLNSDKSIKIFPNPNSGKFQIQVNGNKMQSYKIEILNVLGELVFYDQSISNHFSLKLDLPEGFYLVRVIEGDLIYQKKLFLKKFEE